jgi:hypothetical protein
MDKRDALDIAAKYANAVKSKYDFVKNYSFWLLCKGQLQ